MPHPINYEEMLEQERAKAAELQKQKEAQAEWNRIKQANFTTEQELEDRRRKLKREVSIANGTYKTVECAFFARWGCINGDDCIWAHGKEEVRHVPGRTSSLRKTKDCTNPNCANERSALSCNFRHPKDKGYGTKIATFTSSEECASGMATTLTLGTFLSAAKQRTSAVAGNYASVGASRTGVVAGNYASVGASRTGVVAGNYASVNASRNGAVAGNYASVNASRTGAVDGNDEDYDSDPFEGYNCDGDD